MNLALAALLVFVVVVLTEGMVLRRLAWGTPLRCLGVSLLANLLSFPAALLLAQVTVRPDGVLLFDLAFLFGAAMALEVVVLHTLRRDRNKLQVVRAVVTANTASFILLSLVSVLWLFAGGQ
ncbi:MAG: hypothetical protein AB1758_16600 [Candidatus Eremiobacterota bacterium]